MSERWDRHFLELALVNARLSKDPSTQVGAIIVGPDREVRSTGFNGLPRGLADTPERLHDRALKYQLVVHGEMNAVLAAARIGVSVKGCTLYVACTNAAAAVWGGPPCTRCTVEIIQAGITEIVAHSSVAIPERWRDSTDMARALLAEAGIGYREVAVERVAGWPTVIPMRTAAGPCVIDPPDHRVLRTSGTVLRASDPLVVTRFLDGTLRPTSVVARGEQ